MQVLSITPPVTSFLQVKLDQITIDYLWKIIELAKVKNIDHKNKLVGNISKSILLEDIDYYFFNTVCCPLVKHYRETDVNRRDPYEENTLLQSSSKLFLKDIWVNYQYKTEFNPYHDHSGVYSFAIWLKIPYHWRDQQQLNQFNNIHDSNKKAGDFEFEYIDSLGGIRNYIFHLSSELEGVMLFFPAKLRHCVYPFYVTEEPRISVSGNLFLSP
tara:strand:+ start:979 stop:1620 length:642 start_codon:yes stop_codon:yes gene_type:complete